jgi:hypothetical protein
MIENGLFPLAMFMNVLEQRGHLLTEQVNPQSQNLDQLSCLELVELFNQEDAKTLAAIAKSLKIQKPDPKSGKAW